jgi:hypothetical protein
MLLRFPCICRKGFFFLRSQAARQFFEHIELENKMGCKLVREPQGGVRAKSEKSVTFNDNVTAIPPPESEPASLAGSMINRRTNSSASPEASPTNNTVLTTPQEAVVHDNQQQEVVHHNNDLDQIGRGKIKRRNDSLSLAAVRRSRRACEDAEGSGDDTANPRGHLTDSAASLGQQ